MANLSASRDDERQEGVLIDVPFSTNTIYAGALVTASTTGYAEAGTATHNLLGVAMESTAEAKSVGRDYIRVWTEGVFTFAGSSFTQADVGKEVILSDDHTVALPGQSNTAEIIGKIVGFISATSVRVKISV